MTNDRDILRALADAYVCVIHQPRQAENARLYRALNALKPIRPVVLMDEIPWNQLAGTEELSLRCVGEFERSCEDFFRKELYRARHFACDRVFPAYFPIHRAICIGSFGIDIDENILAFDDGNNIVSHAYHDQLPDDEALEKLCVPTVQIDPANDARRVERALALFGDLLPVRTVGLQYAGYFEPWDNIAQWRGVEPLLWDLMDRPEFMHRLVERILHIRLALLSQLEDQNLLEPDGAFIHCTAGLTDDLPGAMPDGRVTRRNLWGRGAAQIFAAVSPSMHDEFDIDYACRFFEGFGPTYYGCCEPLDRKIDIVRKIPNLRKISVTPWANPDLAADQIGSDYVCSAKPNPSFLATDALDEQVVRAELTRILSACRRNHTPVELTLKDISSVNHHPENLDRWARIAMELAQDFA